MRKDRSDFKIFPVHGLHDHLAVKANTRRAELHASIWAGSGVPIAAGPGVDAVELILPRLRFQVPPGPMENVLR